MAVRITHRHMSTGGTRHEHIQSVKWLNEATNETGVADVYPSMVDYIDNKNGKAYVFDGRYRVEVGTVHPKVGNPYIRTHKDGVWTDNLLSLPTF
jgi:hypothetical protein